MRWSSCIFGTFGISMIALVTGCGTNFDEPVVQLSPAAPGTHDTLRVQHAESDGINYRVQWFLNGDEVDIDGLEVPSKKTERGQTWRVDVTPIDAETGDEYLPGQATVSIGNSPPYGIVGINPPRPLAGQDLVAFPGFTDPDDDTVRFSYSWKKNGNDAGITDDRVSGDRIVKDDVWEVTVVAEDDEGQAEPVSSEVRVVNSPPSVSGAEISPNEVYDDSTLTCAGIGWKDGDEDLESYKTLWLVDGIELSTEDKLTGDQFDRGQVVTCKLTPFDGEDVGPTVTSPPVDVLNGEPRVDKVSLDPAVPSRNSEMKYVVAGAFDADGDDITYTVWWMVNGRGIHTGETLPTKLFKKGDTIQVSVTPNDGAVDGAEVRSTEATVQNAPPVINSSEFVTDPIYTDSVLKPKTSVTDADGDEFTLSYTWYVDGKVVGDASNSLSGDGTFERYQKVKFEIVADDGEAKSAVFKSTVADVVNKPPSTPGLEFDPGLSLPTVNIQCVVAEDSVDADDDKFTYTIEWELDGATYTGSTDTVDISGDTIPSTGTEIGQQYTCYVTASDGLDDSEVAVIATTIRPEEAVYYAESKADLFNRATACGSDGFYGNYGTNVGVGWYFDDDYATEPTGFVLEWRRGRTTDSYTNRNVYINKNYITRYSDSNLGYTTACDSGKKHKWTMTQSVIKDRWKSGEQNLVEFRWSGYYSWYSYNEGVYKDTDLKFGRITLIE